MQFHVSAYRVIDCLSCLHDPEILWGNQCWGIKLVAFNFFQPLAFVQSNTLSLDKQVYGVIDGTKKLLNSFLNFQK